MPKLVPPGTDPSGRSLTSGSAIGPAPTAGPRPPAATASASSSIDSSSTGSSAAPASPRLSSSGSKSAVWERSLIALNDHRRCGRSSSRPSSASASVGRVRGAGGRVPGRDVSVGSAGLVERDRVSDRGEQRLQARDRVGVVRQRDLLLVEQVREQRRRRRRGRTAPGPARSRRCPSPRLHHTIVWCRARVERDVQQAEVLADRLLLGERLRAPRTPPWTARRVTP